MIDEDTTIDIVHGDLNVTIPGKKDNNVGREIPFPNYAVSPIELERRLHELLESRQKEQIEELKVKLKSAEEKLLAKEMELSWWKKHAHQLSKTSVALNNMPGNFLLFQIQVTILVLKTSEITINFRFHCKHCVYTSFKVTIFYMKDGEYSSLLTIY